VLQARRVIQTPYFAFLDDDDELTPGSTDQRVSLMNDNPAADLLVSNFYNCNPEPKRHFSEPQMKRIGDDPLLALMDFNWCHSANVMFRTDRVDIDYFEDSHPFGEWTWLAYRMAMARLRLMAVDMICCAYHNTEGSLSKTAAYRQAYLPLFRRMLALNPPQEIARLVQRKIGAALHNESTHALKSGHLVKAFGLHLRSLACPDGWKYLTYTRNFLLPRLQGEASPENPI
jgi:hypothetical protein